MVDSIADLPVLGAHLEGGFGVVRLGGSDGHRMTAPPRVEHVITVCLSSSERVVQSRLGQVYVSPAHVGGSIVMPSGVESTWEGRIPASVRLAVDPGLFTTAAIELGAAGRTPPNVFQVQDPVFARVAAIAVDDVLDVRLPSRRIIMDGLANVLVGHLLSHYSAGSSSSRNTAALPKAIQRAVRTMHERFAEDLSLQDLADAARVSRFHLSRLFREHTGLTVIDYLQTVRLAEAKRLLREGSCSVEEVASRVGFSTAHFIRLFRQRNGETPLAWARGQSG